MGRRSEFTKKDAKALCRRLINNPTLTIRQLEASMYGNYPKLKKQPQLKDFNLSESILAKNKKEKNRDESIHFFVSLILACIAHYKIADLMLGPSYPLKEKLLMIVFTILPFGIFFFHVFLKLTTLFIFNKKNTDKIDKLYEDYKMACGAYEYQQKLKVIQYWEDMDGREFEYAVAQYFKSKNYQVEITKYSNDGGVDIILYKDSQKIYVQCKHYQKPVGIAPARELYGVMQADNVQIGYLVTLNGCTKGVNEFIKDKNIYIYTLDDLMKEP